METIRSRSPAETESLGRELAVRLLPGDLVLLRGSIGTGKSVLARGIAEGLGAQEWKGSPTFALVNEYETSPPLYHVDLFRLSAPEAEDIGLEDYTRDDAVVVVEWADRAEAYVSELARGRRFEIDIEDRGGDERLISMQTHANTGMADSGDQK
jgi:tRNA threonylcarbamoyladenosine biosynthesis protein TsaE